MRIFALCLCLLGACAPANAGEPDMWLPGEPYPGECDPANRPAPTDGVCPVGTSPVWEDQNCVYVSTHVEEPWWIDTYGWQWRVDTISGHPRPFNGGAFPFPDLIFPYYSNQDSCERNELIGVEIYVPDYNLVPGNVYAIYGGQASYALNKDATRGLPNPAHVWRWAGSRCEPMQQTPGMAWYKGVDFVYTPITEVPVFAGPLSLVCREGLGG